MKSISIIILIMSWAFATPCIAEAQQTAAQATNQPAQKLKVVNIMPAFWKFEKQAQHLTSKTKRVAAFRKLVIEPYKVYDLSEFKKNVTDAGIAHYLKWVQPYLPQIQRLSSQIKTEVKPGLARFIKTFPDFNTQAVTIFILPSFKNFVGQTHGMKNGHSYIMFSPDVTAWLLGDSAHLDVIVSHELFHAYHKQVNPTLFDQKKLYARLWIEGLATYVSAKINPKLSTSEILAMITLGGIKPTLAPQIARAFLPVFSSTNDDSARKFFAKSYKSNLPPTSGYLLGYEVCKRIGHHYTLKQMAHLGGMQLKKRIHSAVEALAKQ